ncbi:uncharacterized protein TNCT_223511 [Trichonephila clavata]|uniref:Uncharacterized protein n=1 Tax=Trichonephila clavata TaxID=2740835 RepID=A0A8X6J7N9_TRICU|nr:uncharacterized protein TNCT_223511 [Trichonephila clavata]
MGNELPSDGVFKGNEDEAALLRNRMTELKKRIEELEGEKATSSTEELNKEKGVLHGDSKQIEKKKVSASLDKLIAGCVGVKAKIEYWMNRNKELEEMTSVLRLELDRLVEKSNENQEIRKEFPVTERELRTRQVEKLEMRRKLDILKNRNEQLEEELTMLKEDTHKMANKTGDDNMLLEALTSQQGSFRDLIERQKMLCDSDYHHFRQDMRKIHSKHTTNLTLVNQLQEDTSEKDEIIRGLQDYMMLSAYAQDEKKEAKTFLITFSSLTSSEKSENQEKESKVVPKADQVKTGEGPPLDEDQDIEQELLKEEYPRLMEWQSQLLNAKATSARSNAELRDLQQACKNLENLLLSSQNKEEGKEKESTMDELLIKKDIEDEIHKFLLNYWQIIGANTSGLFQIYTTGVDRTKKIFIDELRKKRKKVGDKFTVTPNQEGSETEESAQVSEDNES